MGTLDIVGFSSSLLQKSIVVLSGYIDVSDGETSVLWYVPLFFPMTEYGIFTYRGIYAVRHNVNKYTAIVLKSRKSRQIKRSSL